MGGRDNSRYLILLGLVGVLVLSCFIRLFDLQIIQGKTYREQAELRLVRAYPVKAPRGEILDRYENAFVENRMGYVVQLRKIDIDNDTLNDKILDVSHLVLENDGKLETEFPIFYNSEKESFGFTYTDEYYQKKLKEEAKKKSESETETETEEIDKEAEQALKEERQKKLDDWKKENKLTEYTDPKQIVEYYSNKYSVAGKYKDEDLLTVVSVRYDMQKSGFSDNNPYVLAKDVDETVLQQIKERAMDFPGVEVEIEPIRVYAEGSTAAHILGRTGKIYAEEYQELKEKGYGMNDMIGKDGLEKELEEYLKGTDGYKSVSMSREGSVTEILQSQEVQPGNYAKLTLDLELQQAMEKALKENITDAVDRNGAGGAIAIVPSTGEVLGLASYPSYDPSTFDEDYNELAKAKSKPLFNKVLNGTYSPGSTFKPLTAIAGLETGAIEPNTHIVDKGKYTYFSSYQPTCLVYSREGATHGTIETSEALGVSCNYFFFEVGRLTGIEKLNEYAEYFGLGQETGIELGESKGQVASPEVREKAGGEWYPGDVIQTAIGQSDSLFTPAQLANYIATLLNKGRRYKLHLISEVVDYNTGEAVFRKNPEIVSEHTIKDSTFDKVTNGMRQVVTMGTARSAFEGADYKAAGKTGTAEVPGGADNVLFVGFAPYENPEIVVAVVIEHGANSHYAAKVARQVMDTYMELKEMRSNPELAEKYKADKKKAEEENQETDSPKSTSTKKPNSRRNPSPTATSEKGKAPIETNSPKEENKNSGGLEEM